MVPSSGQSQSVLRPEPSESAQGRLGENFLTQPVDGKRSGFSNKFLGGSEAGAFVEGGMEVQGMLLPLSSPHPRGMEILGRIIDLDAKEEGVATRKHVLSMLPSWCSPALREMEPKDQQLMVVLRIRPLSDTELEEGATVIAHKVGNQMVVLMDPGEDPEDTLRTHRSREKTFIFDTVFDQHASQEDVYCATTRHLVEGVISGYNATVFAYGPSGAGKTYTMLGTDTEPGIYLQTLTDLFRAIEETRDNMDYSVSMSYLEIYNEVIRDLLNPSSGFLDLREDSRGSIQIAGITEVSTSHAEEIMQLLTKGNRQRTQELTATNKTSSRSHAVLQVTVRQRSHGADLEEVHVGRLFMVDLASSERASQTQNRGKRMKEGAHINRSLLALGNCINALSEKGGSRAQYVNFRDSKLTRLLKDALGGNSRTVMIAHISPASTYFEESRSTLLYAYRAKNIKTRVKRNLLDVSYRIAQYTDVISNLRREIGRLKAKLERQEKEKRSGPGVRDVQATIPANDTEEDSHLQMNKIQAQLIGAFKEQLEMRRSLVKLENTNIELHIDTSRHLLTITDWEREKTQHQTHRDRTPERDEEPVEPDADGGEGESAEPHEVALAREEVNMLLAEQRKTAALKAGLEQRLANAKKKASQMEKLLPRQAISKDQREVLRLLCRAHELEVENTELQAHSLRRKNLLCQKDFVIQRYHQHRRLCEQIIQDQQQLIRGEPAPPPLPGTSAFYYCVLERLGGACAETLVSLPSPPCPGPLLSLTGTSAVDGLCNACADGGVPVPEPLAQRYRLYSRELGEGALNRLLLLHSVMSSSLRDGSVLSISPPPEESSRDQPDDRKDLPWGAQFELPPMLLETDRSTSGGPTWGHSDSPVTSDPPGIAGFLQKPSSLSVKNLVSKLCSPAGLELGPVQTAAEAGLSAQALKEMAVSTKSIALIAATRRSKAQDREGGSGRSSLHLPEEVAPDPSPADGRWPHVSPCRDRSVERKARRRRSPSFTWSVQLATEKLQPLSMDRVAETQHPAALPQLSKSSGKSFFPAVPAASKIKPSLSFHAVACWLLHEDL
ncbi:PREDICTED: kinesin-like protein KIF19 [Ceratotherium simum simum]|uniref:Kinesin-like protein KIF19 n=1 Tax=Ceratotherium simum simum TaxID=73337 RepID=A0ABM1DH15_CERSS|nr:PREDICTED: kinesin-like protein KIF19 [Ceratotherium simum simum]